MRYVMETLMKHDLHRHCPAGWNVGGLGDGRYLHALYYATWLLVRMARR